MSTERRLNRSNTFDLSHLGTYFSSSTINQPVTIAVELRFISSIRFLTLPNNSIWPNRLTLGAGSAYRAFQTFVPNPSKVRSEFLEQISTIYRFFCSLSLHSTKGPAQRTRCKTEA